MPPAQNAEVKATSQLNHFNGGDQRSKNSGAGSTNIKKSNVNSNGSTHHSQRQSQPTRLMGQPTTPTLPLGAPARNSVTPITSSSHHYHNYPGNNTVAATSQPTTLFQRLVTEEVQELKAYARIIENQNRRLVELERIHGDLENRLELEARGRTQLEATLERRERSWTLKYHKLEKDRDQWKNVVSQEQVKNARLFDQVVRKDQDIHRMLQRKYDNQSQSVSGQPMRNMRHNERQSQGSSPRQTQHNQDPPQQRREIEINKSPHEILATTGSIETFRIRNVKSLLSDFFAC